MKYWLTQEKELRETRVFDPDNLMIGISVLGVAEMMIGLERAREVSLWDWKKERSKDEIVIRGKGEEEEGENCLKWQQKYIWLEAGSTTSEKDN